MFSTARVTPQAYINRHNQAAPTLRAQIERISEMRYTQDSFVNTF